jgi:hypothetical protein
MRLPTFPRVRASAKLICLLAAAGILSVSCGGSGYQYLTDSATHTFVKIPSGWRTYDKAELFPASPRTNPFRDVANPVDYVVAFSANTSTPASELPDWTASQPQGYVLVHSLQGAERDTISYETLRNWVFPLDQIYANDSSRLAVFDQKDLVQTGFRGSQYVYSLRSNPDQIREGTDSFTMNQTAYLDTGTDRLYLLVVYCNSNCYQANQKTIDGIVGSMRLKEPS